MFHVKLQPSLRTTEISVGCRATVWYTVWNAAELWYTKGQARDPPKNHNCESAQSLVLDPINAQRVGLLATAVLILMLTLIVFVADLGSPTAMGYQTNLRKFIDGIPDTILEFSGSPCVDFYHDDHFRIDVEVVRKACGSLGRAPFVISAAQVLTTSDRT